MLLEEGGDAMSNFGTGLVQGLAGGLQQARENQRSAQEQKLQEEMRKQQVKMYDLQLQQMQFKQAEQMRERQFLQAFGQSQGNQQARAALQQNFPDLYNKAQEAELSLQNMQRYSGLLDRMMAEQGRVGGGGGMGLSGFNVGPSGVSASYGYAGPPSFGPAQVLPQGGVGRVIYDARSGAPVGVQPEPPSWQTVQQSAPGGGTQTVIVDPNAPQMTPRVLGTKEPELTPQTAGSTANVIVGQEAIGQMQAMIDQYKANPGGLRKMLGAASLGLPFSEGRQFSSLSKTAADAIIRARTGAAMTVDEWQSIQDELIPGALDSEKAIQSKLDRMTRFLSGQWEGMSLPQRLRKFAGETTKPKQPVLTGDPYQNMSDDEINARIDELERRLKSMRGR